VAAVAVAVAHSLVVAVLVVRLLKELMYLALVALLL
tara:strand:+ start:80 stop:187 length:108 start_codon:yes stop_codon:yes gene_type:complete